MAEREILEVDVLIVGAGLAGLSCAIRLAECVKFNNIDNPTPLETPSILVLEKGPAAGAHCLSGMVLDPHALNSLIPNWLELGAPLTQKVVRDEIWMLSQKRAFNMPRALIPQNLHNAGNYIASICDFTAWLAAQARERGIEILEGVAAAEVVMEGERVLGVRCRDSGIGKDGQPTESFQPGAEIRAKVTVFADGVRGNLTKPLIKNLKLDEGKQPQTYAVGIKETWEIPEGILASGLVVHTLGYPLQRGVRGLFSGVFGGGFLYELDATHLMLGLVAGLDYHDPRFDPHAQFNFFKTHPRIRALLERGRPVAYGAKAIPEGGLHAMPRIYGDGFCIIGDSAGFLNAARLKGAHLAMRSGMLAAEAVSAALFAKNFSRWQLEQFQKSFEEDWSCAELKRVRNWRAAYSRGLLRGAFHELVQRATRGRGLHDPLPMREDFQTLKKLPPHFEDEIVERAPEAHEIKPGAVTFNKVTDVFLSGTHHGEQQPSHLIVPDLKLCAEKCAIEYGNPCKNFCPAAVYEWIGEKSAGHLQINAGNCVHCKTCDIKDPYENIIWTVPEGGDGPRYQKL